MADLVITKDNFDAEVLQSDRPVLVDFWATWCGPCKMTDPIIDELAKEFEGKAKVGKIDVDQEAELAQRFNVLSVPTFMIFKGGQPVGTLVGAYPKPEFEKLINDHL